MRTKWMITLLALVLLLAGCTQTGWMSENGTTSYLDEEGLCLTGWQNIDGKTYYLSKATGCRVQGQWARIDGKTYYMINNVSVYRSVYVVIDHKINSILKKLLKCAKL